MNSPRLTRLDRALVRNDFFVFFMQAFETLNPGVVLDPAWHPLAIAHRLEKLEAGDLHRLLVNIPPRHMKSQIISTAYPAWLLGRDPTARILVTCYDQALCDRLHSDTRRIMVSDWYQEAFPVTASSIMRNTNTSITTMQGGCREAIPIRGGITGHGFRYVIIDDPMKAADARSPVERQKVIDTYRDTLISRLDPKAEGRIIVVMQRLHDDDLSGYILEQGGFEHLNLPAIAQRDEVIPLRPGWRPWVRRIGDLLCPERESLEVLEKTRREMGPDNFRAQYLMDTDGVGGGEIRWNEIQFCDQLPAREECRRILISWDTALSDGPRADYTVGTVWGEKDRVWYLMDVIRGQWDGTTLLRQVRDARRRWKADRMIIEKAGSGIPLMSELMGDQRHRAGFVDPGRCQHIAITPKGGKVERMSIQAHKLYDGMFRLPREAQWLEVVRRELTAFPAGGHDDIVDSISQALHHIPLWVGSDRARRDVR